jgi:hypothetical protein
MKHKSIALIAVVFAMLVFSILGITLSSMVATNFETGARAYDSSEALNLAELGGEWARAKLHIDSGWRWDNTDSVCNWALTPQKFANGQCQVCCRDTTSAETTATGATIAIEAKGYMPQVSNYRAMRQVKVFLSSEGGVDKLIQAKNYFDWTNLDNNASLDGNISVANSGGAWGYEGDGDLNHNEPNIDYSEQGSGKPKGSGQRRFFSQSDYPGIDLNYYLTAKYPDSSDDLYVRWPDDALTRQVVSVTKGVVPIGDNAGTEYAYAESFRLSAREWIGQVRFLLGANQGNPAGAITCEIRNNSSNHPYPGTTVHSSGTCNNPMALAWNTISNMSSFRFVNNTTYWICFSAPAQPTNNFYSLRTGMFVDSNAGQSSQKSGSSWSNGQDTRDMFFELKNSGGTILKQTTKNVIYSQQANFFDNMANQAVRRKLAEPDNWYNDSVNWSRITSVNNDAYGSYAVLADNYADVWANDSAIKLIRCFYGTGSLDNYHYVNSDALLDVSNEDLKNVNFFGLLGTSLVATGDIVINGNYTLELQAWVGTWWMGLFRPAMPLFVTQNGDIISFAPSSHNKRDRKLWGLVYTQNGTVDFDYLYSPKNQGFFPHGMAIMGKDVYLRHDVNIRYDANYVHGTGLVLTTSSQWQEQ